jgi:hypothetical protein
MGGLFIWGVVAAKNSDGVDCASQLEPIQQIEKFRSEVERAISQAIMPQHDGIRMLSILSSSTPGAGYLVIHVERSERRPHRCEFGEKQYFKRIGDSSIAMEHYDIEDSFKRVVVPYIEVEYHLSDGGRRSGPEGSFASVVVSLSLRNRSQVSARFPYLIIESVRGIGFEPMNVHRGFEQPRGTFNGTADDVIHPDLSIFALNLRREIRIREGYLPRGTLQPPILIAFRCGCLHSRPTVGTWEIMEEDVARALNIPIA